MSLIAFCQKNVPFVIIFVLSSTKRYAFLHSWVLCVSCYTLNLSQSTFAKLVLLYLHDFFCVKEIRLIFEFVIVHLSWSRTWIHNTNCFYLEILHKSSNRQDRIQKKIIQNQSKNNKFICLKIVFFSKDKFIIIRLVYQVLTKTYTT